ncbi:MAG: DUF6516 family protein [Pseudomonadota bacterium]|jgi:hypothetical protein
MSIHFSLKERIEARYADALAGSPELKQDALLLTLTNDVALEVRFAARDEYSIAWQWGDALLRIDTAPFHPGLATYPNHLHDADGKVRADPLTATERDPGENLCAVLDALLKDPLLESVGYAE